MKNRRLFALLLTVCLMVCAVSVLVACEDMPLTGTVTLTVGDKAYTVDLQTAKMYTNNNVLDAMEYLASQNSDFTYTGSFSGYGAFISTVGGLELGERQYVALFVSDAQYKDTSAYCLADKTIDGTTYYYSGVGVSGLKLVDGLKVLFVVESY